MTMNNSSGAVPETVQTAHPVGHASIEGGAALIKQPGCAPIPQNTALIFLPVNFNE
jgi:hypothetical protein